jgi:ABC-type oligopeptide transport system substrate-binding subunit
MVEAGYPNGRDKNGKPLMLDYDHSAGMDPSFRSRFDWIRRRLDLIGIKLRDNGTDLSRFRQKRKQGNWQISSGGWLADYPDPENFLFLFYGPNGKVETGGPNIVNYANPEYDMLFKQMESMVNGDERQKIIDKMMLIVQEDAPAIWQFYPVSYVLCHKWYRNVKPHAMAYNIRKYQRIDAELRVKCQKEWNKPVYWPLLVLAGILLLGLLPVVIKKVK